MVQDGQTAVTDELLMSRFQNGDEASFEIIFDRYAKRLVNFACKFLRSQEESEESAQETLLQVYRKKQSFDAKQKFRPWIFAIALRVTYNKIRYQKRHPHESLDFSNEMTDEPLTSRIPDPAQLQPDQIMEKERGRQAVWNALGELPDNQRTAVILARFEGMSQEEIADTLNLSVSSVKSLIFRARESLKSSLQSFINK